jgi:hypothetical protein
MPGGPVELKVKYKKIIAKNPATDDPQNVEPTVRKFFPESWIFDSLQVDANGTDEYVN